MNYKNLGNTGLKVSTICLGTMTWGEQNSEKEGFEQMDFALSRGVNFWDTAEIYSIPMSFYFCRKQVSNISGKYLFLTVLCQSQETILF